MDQFIYVTINYFCEKLQKMAKQELRDQLLSQLHEQYAINDNEKNQNFITFLIAIFALMGAYGYVYVHTYFGENLNKTFENIKMSTICCSNSNELYFHPDIIIYLTILISLVMLFLSVLVIVLGYSTRRDHIIIHRIRNFAYDEELNKYLFKNNLFNPLNKSTCDFLPDYYRLFFWTFQVINWGLFVLTYILLPSVYFKCICFWISLAVSVISIFILCEYYSKYSKYIECECDELKIENGNKECPRNKRCKFNLQIRLFCFR